jgi:VanZ family protein
MIDNTGLARVALDEQRLSNAIPGPRTLPFRRWRWGLLLGCGLLLGYAVFSRQPPPMLFQHADKVGHLLGFAALASSARLTLGSYPDMPGRVRVLWLWAVLVVVALGAEWLQPLVSPLRQFSLEDIAANLAGVLLGALLSRLVWSLRHRQAKAGMEWPSSEKPSG